MTIVACPTCQRPVEWSAAARYRPFCSERCKLIDLGAWISEKHAIPGEEITTGADDGSLPATRTQDDGDDDGDDIRRH